jgi:Co/Zn/Cd efflux system component
MFRAVDQEAANLLVAGSMILSMAVVAIGAAVRLAKGGSPIAGPGAILAVLLNGAYALVNGGLAWRWYRQLRQAPCPLARSQIRLFADKLSSNLLIVGGLGLALLLQDWPLARYCDPLASFLMAAMTAWWSRPVVVSAYQRLLASGSRKCGRFRMATLRF